MSSIQKRLLLVLSLALIILGLGIMFNNNSFHVLAKQTNADIKLLDKRAIAQNKPILTGEKTNTPTVKNQNILTTNSYTKLDRSKPILYIFFKPGCSKCQDAFPYEEKAFTKVDKKYQKRIVYVNVSSKIGVKLIKKFKIPTPYTAVYEYAPGHIVKKSVFEPNKQLQKLTELTFKQVEIDFK